MIDLTQIDDDTLIARGAFSTVNAKLREEMKRLQNLCDQMACVPRVILHHMQPSGDAIPVTPNVQLALGRATLEEMELCIIAITELMEQKKGLRHSAWGAKK